MSSGNSTDHEDEHSHDEEYKNDDDHYSDKGISTCTYSNILANTEIKIY